MINLVKNVINLLTILLVILLLVTNLIQALDNGLCATPPMGWLSWERFGCNIKCDTDPKNCISEKLFMEMADRLVDYGYRDVGYDRVNIDDCWMERSRTENGVLMADKKRFPNGIKYLSDYVHSKALKFGIYQNYGLKTCMGFPGLIGYLKIDAQTYAEWEVDMVKLDACFTPVQTLDKGYIEFGEYLNASGRPMVYSCSWPYYQLLTSKIMIPDWTSIAEHCNLWRTYHDIHANWKSLLLTIDFAGDNQDILTRHVSAGKWNDPDMLLIGNSGLTVDQCKVQMGIWAILAAPLFMSNDLRNIKPEFKNILLNKEVIDINQDKMVIPGKRIYHSDSLDIWLRPILPKSVVGHQTFTSYAIAFVNRKHTKSPLDITVKLKDLGLTSTYKLKELFDETDLGQYSADESLEVSVPSTGIRLYNARIAVQH